MALPGPWPEKNEWVCRVIQPTGLLPARRGKCGEEEAEYMSDGGEGEADREERERERERRERERERERERRAIEREGQGVGLTGIKTWQGAPTERQVGMIWRASVQVTDQSQQACFSTGSIPNASAYTHMHLSGKCSRKFRRSGGLPHELSPWIFGWAAAHFCTLSSAPPRFRHFKSYILVNDQCEAMADKFYMLGTCRLCS